MNGETMTVLRAGTIGELALPEHATALVLLVDARAPRRVAPRERQIAELLQARGIATLRSDSLEAAPAGSATRAAVGPAERIDEMLDWAGNQRTLAGLGVGILAAGAAAAAALRAAAHRPARVAALVARSAKPDLASESLALVQAPTLLIVGGADTELLAGNRALLARLVCSRRLEIVPGATRGFKERGAFDTMAHLACAWFETHLAGASSRAGSGAG